MLVVNEFVLEHLKCNLESWIPIADCVDFQHASQRCCNDSKLRRKTLVKTINTEEGEVVLEVLVVCHFEMTAIFSGLDRIPSALTRNPQNSISCAPRGTHFSFSVEILTSE